MPPSLIARPSTGDYLLMLFHDAVKLGKSPAAAEFQAGTMVIWRPGDSHHYGNGRRRWAHSWIHCSGGFVARTLRDAGAQFDMAFTPTDGPAVLRHLFYLHEELTLAAEPDPAIVRATLLLLAREATRGLRGRTGDRTPVPAGLAAAMRLINDRYAEHLTLTRLASAAAMSVPHICGRFRQQFGETPMASLAQRRLEVAGVLLRCTDATVAAIGGRVGYPDPAHFSKVFALNQGACPSRARGR